MRHTLAVFVVLAFITACAPPAGAPAATIVRYSTEGKFETVRDELQGAIVARGLVVDNVSYVGRMLDRTGKDVGSTQPIFAGGNAQTFSFCSALLSRKSMEADPHTVAFCPYTLVVYRTAAEPNRVYVAYRRPIASDANDAARAALKDVENLLDGIARDAVGMKRDTK